MKLSGGPAGEAPQGYISEPCCVLFSTFKIFIRLWLAHRQRLLVCVRPAFSFGSFSKPFSPFSVVDRDNFKVTGMSET